jgi:osmotically-inducible protein OsmY
MKTDQQLKDDVTSELRWDPSIDAKGIGITVHDGVVTLMGEVDTYSQKLAAEHAAQRVAGLEALAIELSVKLAGSDEHSDADIARTAESALEWTTALPSNAVKVMVEQGWVTLSGTVHWHFQRQVAVERVRHLLGVTGVSNDIRIEPTISTGAVRADIEAALARRAMKDARQIAVRVHGADVTLSGPVHSWAEREIALNSAWGAPGVRRVVDDMTLAD